MPTYLDPETGEPLAAKPPGKVYLDPETGERIAGPSLPAPEESISARAGRLSKTIDDTTRNLALGAVKGAGSVGMSALRSSPVIAPSSLIPIGLRALASQFPSIPILSRFAGASEEAAAPEKQMFSEADAALHPEGTAQRIGSAGAKAAPALALAAATGGASLPLQAGLQAGLAGAQSEAKTPGGIALDATIGGGSVLAGGLAAKGISGLGKLAVREYTKALRPTTVAAKTTAARIVPELLERGVSGSVPKLAAVGSANATTAGEAIGQAYGDATRSGVTVDAPAIAASLEALKKPFIGAGPEGPIVLHQGAVDAIQGIQDTLAKFGDKASPEELWRYRKVLDDVVQASNGFTRTLPPQTATAISRGARRTMQDALTSAVPGVETPNADYALWKGLADVASATAKRQQGQTGIVGDALRAGAAHAAASGAAGALGFGAAGVPGLAAAAVPYVYTRPAVRTALAVALHRLAPGSEIARLVAPAVGQGVDSLARSSGDVTAEAPAASTLPPIIEEAAARGRPAAEGLVLSRLKTLYLSDPGAAKREAQRIYGRERSPAVISGIETSLRFPAPPLPGDASQ